MSKQQSQLTALILPSAASADAPGISSIIKKYLYHWPLFVIGVTICLIAAYFYLQAASPVYPITATLKFKTPTSASGAPLTINDNSLENLDPASNPIIVENELEVMHSKKIIYKVVNDLRLWVNYSVKQGLSTTDLYNKAPVSFQFTDSGFTLPSKGVKLNIILQDGNTFLLKDSKLGDKVYHMLTPVNSSFGTWLLKPMPNYQAYLGKELFISINDPDVVSNSYLGRIKVELQDKNAPFVNLSTTDAVPARGKDVLNAVMTIYRANAQQEKNEQTQKLLDFASTRVDTLKQQLDTEAEMLEQFKRTYGITDLNAQASNLTNTKDINTRSINDINVALSTINSLENYVNSTDNAVKLPASSEDLPDKSLTALYDRLAALQLEREQKLAITPISNPLFIPIDRQITTLKNDFREKIEVIKASLLANKRQLKSFDGSLNHSISQLPNWEKEYNALRRDLENKESIYKFLASKKEEVALRFASLIQDSDIVDDAHAGSPSWPKPTIVYAIALLLGLGGAAGIIYARESLNEQISSRKQIEEGAEVPILGELAYQDNAEPIVITGKKNRFAIGEQFRVLRTNLYHLLDGTESGRVSLFTSSVSGEGKSFVSSNLAITLAYARRKTIILEMDLRKPKISSVFGLPANHPGIANYLNGDACCVKGLIQPSGIPNLDVLGCGAVLPNPSELLDTERLDKLIDELKNLYDDIIIDSPPIHLVTDSLIIGRVADVCLYVVRQGYTHKGELEFIKEIKETNRFKKFVIVFNGVKRDAAYGYQGYGGYDNYNAYAEKEKWNIGQSFNLFLKRF